MSISVNGQSCVPPGFRFHPTEEELLNYYLRKKVASEKIDLDVIRDVDLNKLEPWDIQEMPDRSTPQNDWYFFSHKDKKYPTGTRTNRATAAGFWKATGRDKVIYASSKRIGMRKTLVFYKGRAPHGQNLIGSCHEYRLDDHLDLNSQFNAPFSVGETTVQEEGWVVCRVFKKKNHHKAIDCPNNSCSSITIDTNIGEGALDQIFQYMGRSCKQETGANNNIRNIDSPTTQRYFQSIDGNVGLHERFMKLPALEIPPAGSHDYINQTTTYQVGKLDIEQAHDHSEVGVTDWAALDRLIANHLNGQSESSKHFDDSTFTYCLPVSHDHHQQHHHHGVDDGDLWTITRSASDPSMSGHISQVSHSSL